MGTSLLARSAPAVVTLGLSLALASPASAIVGGRQATPTDNPAQVGLVIRGQSAQEALFCGGTLIAPQVVVSAMHCLGTFQGEGGDLARRIDVVGGAISRVDPGMQRVQVASIVKHPQYDDQRTLHDVLVLKLAAPINAPTAELAGPGDEALEAPGTVLSATGWGLTDYRDDDSQPTVLKQADIPLVAGSVCESQFGSSIYFSEVELCGSSPNGRPDTCQGDSGGPLVGRVGEAIRLVGIVSYGPASCGVKGNAAVYARVTAERSWILGAAGIADTAPAPTTPAAPVVAPATVRKTVRLRIGSISCGATTCRTTLRASGSGRSQVREVILRASRPAQEGLAPAKRFVRAKRVATGVYRASTLLPLGRVTLSAAAYDRDGAQISPTVRETVVVE